MSPLAISLRFLQTQPDERLVALAREGHERAFEALVRRYRAQLLSYCRRVAPRDTSPEDILQQGLLQAWRALSGGAEVRDARAWLYRIVHNVAINVLRASGDQPDGVLPGAAAPGVEQVVEQRLAARDALAGIAALPDLQRQVMVSTALDGRSHEEIAAALGLSSGSVRGLIYRARSTLRAAAAALIPAPVLNWALGDASGAPAGLAGAGSAGLGALIVKGSAIVAVGALAGTTALIVDHHAHRAQPRPVARAESASNDRSGTGRASETTARVAAGPIALASLVRPAAAARGGGGDAHRIGRAPATSGRNGRGDGGNVQTSGSRGDGSGDGSGNGSATGSSGSGDGSRAGSDGGGDHGGTTGGGHDGSGDHPVTADGTRGGDGGSSGGDSSGGDGGGDGGDGGSSTPTTSATPSTTATTPTSTSTIPAAATGAATPDH